VSIWARPAHSSVVTDLEETMSTPSTAARSAAIYLRRSSRKDEGANRSLVEQETECRALAARVDLDVVDVYREREVTGASTRSRKARPEWVRARADLDEGSRFGTVIIWALDRADHRGADTLAALLTRHAASGRRLLGVDGTDTSDEQPARGLRARAGTW
jgi:site-specific DNA recombinase